MNLEQATLQLLEVSSTLRKISELSSIANYDMIATAAKGAAARRGELLRYSGDLQRQTLLSDQTRQLVSFLSEPEQYDQLNDELKGEVHLFKRAISQSEGVPASLLGDLAALRMETEQLWIKVKEQGPYDELTEKIGQLITLNKEIAQARLESQHLDAPEHPLDPIIDETDEGMTVARLDKLFQEVSDCAVPLLREIKKCPAIPDLLENKAPLAIEKQKEFLADFMDHVGYKKEYGIIGTGMHPCTYFINCQDVRFTNHFYEDNMLTALNSAMHEGGHGMYSMYVSPDYMGRMIDGGISGSIQESSSRFWEICIGRSKAYWEYTLLHIQNTLGLLKDVTPMDCYRSLNRLSESPYRMRADELTYNLHIIIRFEIEKRLFDGSLKPSEIESAWNELSKKLLGFVPKNAATGWLQDMHWPSSLFGYFQSYSIGNINSAQIEATLRKEMPDLDDVIRKGDFSPILEWLKTHWYRQGRIYTPDETMIRLTGETSNAKYLCRHLEEKYKELYGIS